MVSFGQVIGAVGFMNQRLEFPKDLDPQWAPIIESCWHRLLIYPWSFLSFFFCSRKDINILMFDSRSNMSIAFGCSEPHRRPTFQELLETFKDLLRQYIVQNQIQRSTAEEATAAKMNVS